MITELKDTTNQEGKERTPSEREQERILGRAPITEKERNRMSLGWRICWIRSTKESMCLWRCVDSICWIYLYYLRASDVEFCVIVVVYIGNFHVVLVPLLRSFFACCHYLCYGHVLLLFSHLCRPVFSSIFSLFVSLSPSFNRPHDPLSALPPLSLFPCSPLSQGAAKGKLSRSLVKAQSAVMSQLEQVHLTDIQLTAAAPSLSLHLLLQWFDFCLSVFFSLLQDFVLFFVFFLFYSHPLIAWFSLSLILDNMSPFLFPFSYLPLLSCLLSGALNAHSPLLVRRPLLFLLSFSALPLVVGLTWCSFWGHSWRAERCSGGQPLHAPLQRWLSDWNDLNHSFAFVLQCSDFRHWNVSSTSMTL